MGTIDENASIQAKYGFKGFDGERASTRGYGEILVREAFKR